MANPKIPAVLHNAANVIDALAEHGPLTPAELAQLIETPRPTVYRLVEGLAAIDFVRSQEDGRIALSLRWLHLADTTRQGRADEDVHAALGSLAARTGQTAFLTVPRSQAMMCVDWAQGRGIEILLLKPGRELPLYAGAGGRIGLAHLGRADREDYLAGAPFPAFTAHTLTAADELTADIATSLENGFCLSDEDVTPSIGALGVPLLDDAGGLVACLSLAGSAHDIKTGSAHFVRELYETANSSALQHHVSAGIW